MYPRNVYGTVTATVYPMYDLELYLYDGNDDLIDTLYFYYGFGHGQWTQDYDFCRKNINAYGHPFPWFLCAEYTLAVRDNPQEFRNCSAPIFSYSFTDSYCDPSRPSARRDIGPGGWGFGSCVPNPCGF